MYISRVLGFSQTSRQTDRQTHGKTGRQATHTKILISTYMYSHRVYTFEKLGNIVQKSD